MTEPRVWLGPQQPDVLVAAVAEDGAPLVEVGDANVIVWFTDDHTSASGPANLAELLHDGIEWVQLDSAGIERWVSSGVLDQARVWTSAAGAYADAVAEHVVMCLLAGARRLPEHTRARSWRTVEGVRFAGATVGIVGAGAIGERTIELLAPFGVRTIALTRTGREVRGAERSLGPDGLDELLSASDYVVLAAPITPSSRHLLGPAELAAVGPTGTLVNVGRGELVRTQALVDALSTGTLGWAFLDVTDPEPLPDGHPLWALPNAVVTPHVANTWGMLFEDLARRVRENLRRFRAGEELLGRVNLEAGY
jgi:D-3-phosphoglycerate dehydrogenase